MTRKDPMRVQFARIALRNPVVLAAGTCGYVAEMADVLDLTHVGALITKSITVDPRDGNQPPRIHGLPAGMINAIGLANKGLDRFIDEEAPLISQSPTLVIGSIAGHSIKDYVAVAEAFEKLPEMQAVELNVSCPNTGDGLVFGEDPDALASLLREIRPILHKTTLIVKLSPNVPSIVQMAATAVEAGTDAISMINTFRALCINVHSRKPVISRGIAGYSGAGIHPIAVRMVYEVYTQVTSQLTDRVVPILAYGGITKWEDAAAFILAGAHAIGIGSALFADPRVPVRIARGLEKWVQKQNVDTVGDLIGQYEES